MTDTHNFIKEAEQFLEIEEKRGNISLKFGPEKAKLHTKPVTIKYAAGKNVVVHKPRTPDRIFTRREHKSVKSYIREDYVQGKKMLASEQKAKADDIENFHKKQTAEFMKKAFLADQTVCCKVPTNMLKHMKEDEENYYYSVPRPYKHMIGQATEIDQEIAKMGTKKVSAF